METARCYFNDMEYYAKYKNATSIIIAIDEDPRTNVNIIFNSVRTSHSTWRRIWVVNLLLLDRCQGFTWMSTHLSSIESLQNKVQCHLDKCILSEEFISEFSLENVVCKYQPFHGGTNVLNYQVIGASQGIVLLNTI